MRTKKKKNPNKIFVFFFLRNTLVRCQVHQTTNVSSLIRVFHRDGFSPVLFTDSHSHQAGNAAVQRTHGITAPHSAALLSRSISSEELG